MSSRLRQCNSTEIKSCHITLLSAPNYFSYVAIITVVPEPVSSFLGQPCDWPPNIPCTQNFTVDLWEGVSYIVVLNQSHMLQLLNVWRDEGRTHTLLQDSVDNSQFHQYILAMSNDVLTCYISEKDMCWISPLNMMTSAGLNDDFSFKYFSLKEWKPQF